MLRSKGSLLKRLHMKDIVGLLDSDLCTAMLSAQAVASACAIDANARAFVEENMQSISALVTVAINATDAEV